MNSPELVNLEFDKSQIPQSSEVKLSPDLTCIGGDFIIEEKFVPEDPNPPWVEKSKVFICKICSKLFKKFVNLSNHVKICQKPSVKQCKICYKYFPTLSAYSKHLGGCWEYYQKIGNGEGRFVCPIGGCLAEFNSKTKLNLHTGLKHSDRKYICKFCGMKFNRLWNKKIHEKFHPKGSMERLKRGPKRKARLRIKKIPIKSKKQRIKKDEQNDFPHVNERPRRSTRTEVDYAKLEEDSDSSGSSRTSETASLSSILGGNDQSDLESDEEMPESEESESEFSKKSGQSRKVKGHQELILPSVDPKNIFHCGNCKQSFYSNAEFALHREICLQITISGDFIKCKFPDCPSIFRKESLFNYNSHIERKHNKVPSNKPKFIKSVKPTNYPCDLCGKNWLNGPKKLRLHKKIPHTFPCGKCSLQFISLKEKEIHWGRVHLEDTKKFVCPREGCPSKFNTKYKLERHEISVHKKGNINNFRCPICLESFCSYKEKIREHLVRHKFQGKSFRIECEICHLFLKSNRIQEHEKSEIHLKLANNEEEFILPDKDPNPIDSLLAQYSTSKDLGILEDGDMKHVESFQCPNCDLKFRKHYFRRKHQEAVHGLESHYFHCDLCDIGFNRKYSYQNHVKNSLSHQAKLRKE